MATHLRAIEMNQEVDRVRRKIIRRLVLQFLFGVLWTVMFAELLHRLLYFLIIIEVLVSLHSLFRSKLKYLAGIEANAGQFQIIFISSGLRIATDNIPGKEILFTEISQTGFVFKYPLELNIKTKDGWRVYDILDRRGAEGVVRFLDLTRRSQA